MKARYDVIAKYLNQCKEVRSKRSIVGSRLLPRAYHQRMSLFTYLSLAYPNCSPSAPFLQSPAWNTGRWTTGIWSTVEWITEEWTMALPNVPYALPLPFPSYLLTNPSSSTDANALELANQRYMRRLSPMAHPHPPTHVPLLPAHRRNLHNLRTPPPVHPDHGSSECCGDGRWVPCCSVLCGGRGSSRLRRGRESREDEFAEFGVPDSVAWSIGFWSSVQRE
jgi:hypothetical protein